MFIRDANGLVAGEVGAQGVNRSLSVAPGRYFVRGRAPAYLLEGTVEVARGQVLEVRDSALSRVDYARLARKGGAGDAVHGPQAGYSMRTALRNASGLCHGAFVGYSFVVSALTVTPRAEWCRTGFANEVVTAEVDAFGFALRGAHVWDLPVFSLELGAELGGELHRQRFETRGVAPSRDGPGGYVGVGAGIGLDLGSGFTLFAESDAESHVFALRSSETKESQTSASFAFRQRVGVMKLW